MMESGLSDIEFMSDEDDDLGGWGSDSGDDNGDEGPEDAGIEREEPPETLEEEIEDSDEEILEMETGELLAELEEATTKKPIKRRKGKLIKSEKEIRIENFMIL